MTQVHTIEANGRRGLVLEYPADDERWSNYAKNLFQCILAEITRGKAKSTSNDISEHVVVPSER